MRDGDEKLAKLSPFFCFVICTTIFCVIYLLTVIEVSSHWNYPPDNANTGASVSTWWWNGKVLTTATNHQTIFNRFHSGHTETCNETEVRDFDGSGCSFSSRINSRVITMPAADYSVSTSVRTHVDSWNASSCSSGTTLTMWAGTKGYGLDGGVWELLGSYNDSDNTTVP